MLAPILFGEFIEKLAPMGVIVEERKLTMLMWADRLLEDRTFGYGKWEASANGTATAIDKIPRALLSRIAR
jgi:hypothetical protein